MKTVLFVSPTGTLDNGAEISIFHFMKFLAQQGYKVINEAPIYYGGSEKVHEAYKKEFESFDIKTNLLPAGKWWWEEAPGVVIEDDTTRTFYYRDNIARIRKVIQNEKVDLVITNTVNMFQGAIAAACESIPHYWLIHEFPENEFSYYKEKIDFVSEYSTEIYSVTGNLNQTLAPLFKDRQIKSFIPYSEVNTQELKAGAKKRIVSVGRLTERKNQLELIKAYQKTKQDIELVFVGAYDEEYKKLCDDYIKKNHIKNISFTGHLDNPWEFLTDKDLFVSSSKNETFGLVYVEAVLNGIPTIISDNLGHESAYNIIQSGQKYHLGNENELARMIDNALENFDELKRTSLASVESAKQNYSIKTAYQEILSDIERPAPEVSHSIRHIANLVSLNEIGKSSFSARVIRKIKRLLK